MVHGWEPCQAQPKKQQCKGAGGWGAGMQSKPSPAPHACDPSRPAAAESTGSHAVPRIPAPTTNNRAPAPTRMQQQRQQRLTRVGHGAVLSEVQVASVRLQRHARLWEGEQDRGSRCEARRQTSWEEDAGAGAESLVCLQRHARPLQERSGGQVEQRRGAPRGARQRQQRHTGRQAPDRCASCVTPNSCTCLAAGCRQATCTAGGARWTRAHL